MSYIEKEKLIKADIASIENRVRHAFNQGYDLGFKDGKERAKALEQETVSKESYDHEYFLRKELEIKISKLEQQKHILDKIRAEIDNALSDGMIHKKTVLGIIDKYKAETEDKE